MAKSSFVSNRFGMLIAMCCCAAFWQTSQAQAAGSGCVVVSQVYGGGGIAGATLRNDFIELFNRGTVAVNVSGWSVQFATSTGSGWTKTDITTGSIAPGQYFLIQQGSSGANGALLPTPDLIGSIFMATAAGKIALVNNQTLLSGSCPSGPQIIDFVGYGAGTNCFEGGGPTGSLLITTAAIRNGGGCTETNANNADFTVALPTPRNSASPTNNCGLPADGDCDGIPDASDNCPMNFNPGQENGDGDSAGDACDGCPADVNKTSPGICGCGTPDTDTDSDGTPDCIDGCPTDPDKIVPGACGCNVPDVDTDSDGTPDCIDGCPTDPNKIAPGICGCNVSDVDTDSDGTPDCNDGCPTDPDKIAAGICGCNVSDVDTDSDGTADCNDGCPTDPNKIAAGICGCNVSDVDTDSDGTPDCNDACPTDPNKIAPGICGCNVSDVDTDSDGTPDCKDDCPTDPNKTSAGQCGCGNPDTDTDGDGTADCNDGCPNDPNKIAAGICGCGVADAGDADMDGVLDCVDNCPSVGNPGQEDGDMDGKGDACDNCPMNANPGQEDTDMDGAGDACDGCPNDPNKTAAGQCGCGVADTDTDSDGVADCNDNCDNASNPMQEDADMDGIGDACDNCPSVSNPDQQDSDMDTLGDACDPVPFNNSLVLEVPNGCQGTNGQLTVKLWMRQLTQNANGFQAFLSFDENKLTYRGNLSSYSTFPLHVVGINSAFAHPGFGLLQFDGSSPPNSPGTNVDSLLATLVFDVTPAGDCMETSLDFRVQGSFSSELSLNGVPVMNPTTNTVATRTFLIDASPPIFTVCPENFTVQCDPTTPLPQLTDPSITGQAVANDTCGGPVLPAMLTYQDSVGEGKCAAERIITRTWTATDACGNQATCIQQIFVVDTTPPVITECSAQNATVGANCTGLVSFTATVQDNCCHGTVEVNAMVDPTSLHSAQIGVPDFIVTPDPMDDRIVHVSGTVSVSAIDGCPVIVKISVDAEDCCFNEAQTCMTTASVTDEEAPIITCPMDVTVNCNESTDPNQNPYVGFATATDNCTSQPVIDWSDEVDVNRGGPICPFNHTITRTWTATDNCGNVASCQQHITQQDLSPPTLLTCGGGGSAYMDAACTATINFNATFIDNCCITAEGVSVTVLLAEGVTVDDVTFTEVNCVPTRSGYQTQVCIEGTAHVSGLTSCPGYVKLRIAATDCCGNTTSDCEDLVDTRGKTECDTCYVHTYVYDNMPPTLECPMDVLLSCGAPTDPSSTGVALVNDNCPLAVVLTYTDVCLTQPQRIIRTWTAIDGCYNSAFCDQTITFDDQERPVITCPPTLFLECIEQFPAACGLNEANLRGDEPPPPVNYLDCFVNELGGMVSDNCGLDKLEVHIKNIFDAGPSQWPPCAGDPLIVVIIFEAVDGAGLTATCKMVVIVQDDQAPTITQQLPTSNPAEVDIDANCSAVVPVELCITDCNLPTIRSYLYWNVSVASGDAFAWSNLDVCFVADNTIKLCGNIYIDDVYGCQATVVLHVDAYDYCGNNSDYDLVIHANNHLPPTIGCLIPTSQPGRDAEASECDIITVYSDAGICGAVVYYSAQAWGHCGSGPVTITCEPPSGSMFPVGDTAVVCTATDNCGNMSSRNGTIRVLDKTRCTATVQLHLVNAGSGYLRPITFIPRNGTNCGAPICTDVFFSGTAPATGTAIFDVPCGEWTSLCAKDEQHTLWDTQSVIVSNNQYVVPTPYLLRGGDTDNDGDVDINDVTFWVLSFSVSSGGPGPACNWSTAIRSANFNNDGNTANLDYSFFVNLATTMGFGFPYLSQCDCSPVPMTNPMGTHGTKQLVLRASTFSPDQAAKVDLNKDGLVDYKDIAIFERQNKLSNTISTKLREATAAALSSDSNGR